MRSTPRSASSKCAAAILLGRGHELVIEAEPVEKRAQHRIVVVRKAFELAERIGNFGERLAQMLAQHIRVGHVVRHLAQAVHVVAERHQPRRRAAGQRFVGAADQRGAEHLLKRADVRQARRAIAGFEQHGTLRFRLATGIAFDQLARFLKRPCLGSLCCIAVRAHVCFLFVPMLP